jgi:hypothetical protein
MFASLFDGVFSDLSSPAFVATVASIYLVHSRQVFALTEAVAARAGLPGRITLGGSPTVLGGALHAVVAVLVARFAMRQAQRLA